MSYRDTAERLKTYRAQIKDIRDKMRALQADIAPEEVSDYEFATMSGKVCLSSLFGDKDTLLVVHNMGTGCVNCTMWADGFNGVYGHLADRAVRGVVTRSARPDPESRPAVSPPITLSANRPPTNGCWRQRLQAARAGPAGWVVWADTKRR